MAWRVNPKLRFTGGEWMRRCLSMKKHRVAIKGQNQRPPVVSLETRVGDIPFLRTKRHIRSPMDWHEPDCDTSIVAPRLQLPPAPQRHPSTGIPIGATSACIGLRQSWERGSATLAVSTLARVRAAVPLEPAPKKEIWGGAEYSLGVGTRPPQTPGPRTLRWPWRDRAVAVKK